MEITTIVIAVLVGMLIGVLAGLLGVGGGTVMVPVFKLGFGMAAIHATATSLFAIIPTAISGSITHLRQKTCIPKLGILAGVGGALFSPIGVQLANISPGWLIMLAAACVIGYSAITMFRKALALPKTGKSPAAAPRKNRAEKQESPVPSVLAAPQELGKRLWLGLPIGAAAGLIAGYVGVGGGFLMVPLFLSVLEVDMKHASGTSLLAISILSLPAVIMQILLGHVEVAVALAVVAGSVPGSVAGSKLVKYVPERELRFAFAIMLVVAAIMLVVQELVVS